MVFFLSRIFRRRQSLISDHTTVASAKNNTAVRLRLAPHEGGALLAVLQFA